MIDHGKAGARLTNKFAQGSLTTRQYAAAMVRLFDPYKAPEQIMEIVRTSTMDVQIAEKTVFDVVNDR